MPRKFRILLCVVLAVLSVLCVATGCRKRTSDHDKIFRNEIAGQVGKHIYYSYNLMDDRELTDDQREAVLRYLKKLDKSLVDDIYVTGSNTLYGRSDFKIYARQITDGIVVDAVTYVSDLDSDTIKVLLKSDIGPVNVPDRKEIKQASEFFDIVNEEASKHTSEMNMDSSMGILGTYLLRYDMDRGILIYDFTVNEFSHIYIDATTGEIIESHYWNGAISD